MVAITIYQTLHLLFTGVLSDLYSLAFQCSSVLYLSLNYVLKRASHTCKGSGKNHHVAA